MKAICGRCNRMIEVRDAQLCSFCTGPLCGDCWQEWGTCGHPGEDEKVVAAKERFRQTREGGAIGRSVPAPKTTIREDEYASLWYHPEAKVVHHKTHKFMPAGIFQDFLTAGAECLEQNNARKWLSDDRRNTVLRKDDFEWGRNVWAPRVVRAGFKFWAIVPPAKLIGQMQMSGIIEEYAQLGVTIQTFEDDAAALQWLWSVDKVDKK